MGRILGGVAFVVNEDERRVRVLLVEDDENFRWVTRRMIQQRPSFEVVGESADGREGVQATREFQPDVVLLDLRMPVMDGFEALPLIREACPGARVIVYTGLSSREVREKAARLGAFDVVEKDARPDALFDALERAKDPAGAGSASPGATARALERG